mgnify:CR=1 FL=1
MGINNSSIIWLRQFIEKKTSVLLGTRVPFANKEEMIDIFNMSPLAVKGCKTMSIYQCIL